LLGNTPVRLRLFFFHWVWFPHTIEAVFLLGLRGFLWVWIMGSQNFMGSGYGSNIRDNNHKWLESSTYSCP
jgi:hypothetical protein